MLNVFKNCFSCENGWEEIRYGKEGDLSQWIDFFFRILNCKEETSRYSLYNRVLNFCDAIQCKDIINVDFLRFYLASGL